MPQPEGNRLDSWKEIAAYLGRDERTVRRWEKDKGLPVRRVPGGERKAVFAYSAEIEAWLHAANSLNDSSSWWHKPIFTLRRATFAVILVSLLAVMAFKLVLMDAKPFYNLDRVNFSGNSLQAWSPEGDLLWTHSFGKRLEESGSKDPGRILIFDAHEEGQKRILVSPPFYSGTQTNPSDSDPLIVLSSYGKLLWRHEFADTFQFGGNRYGPPWFFGASRVTQEGVDSYVWSAADSHFGSPSTLVKLDYDGRLLGNFVNWGHIHVLNEVHTANGSFILAGGINNECNCAMLAVLREDQPSGSSPALRAANGAAGFQCDNCPPGEPYRYMLFPRSEVNIATGTTYNQVTVIQAGEGETSIGVRETDDGESLGADWEIYKLSADFMPQRFEISDHQLLLHRQFESQGKIQHKLEHCPELHTPRAVKFWSPEGGWRDVPVRSIQYSLGGV